MVASGREVAAVGTRGTSRGAGARGLSIYMGTIVEYYTFYGANHGPVFVLLQEHNVVSTHGVMFVVEASCQAEHVVHIDIAPCTVFQRRPRLQVLSSGCYSSPFVTRRNAGLRGVLSPR